LTAIAGVWTFTTYWYQVTIYWVKSSLF